MRAAGLDERDRLELLLALGQSLFLEDDFGAAAEIFESGLDARPRRCRSLPKRCSSGGGARSSGRPAALSPRLAEGALRPACRPDEDGARANPTSPAASYWTVVGSARRRRARTRLGRGGGRLGARAADRRQRGGLRADLDQLVLEGIIPDRVRHLPQDQRAGRGVAVEGGVGAGQGAVEISH